MAGVKGRSGGKREGAGRKRKPVPPPSMEDVLLPSADREQLSALGIPAPVPPAPPPGDTDQPVIQLPEDAAAEPIPACDNPLEFLERVMNDTRLGLRERLRAAVAAAQYRHTKSAEEGKKKRQARTAEETVGSGRLAPMAPPKLQAVPGRRVA